MMGRLKTSRASCSIFCLDEVVPEDHLVRDIAAVLDLSWVHAELAPHYPKIGRAFDRSGTYVCDPLGAAAVQRGAGEPCLQVVSAA